jgi:hypothetical protein
VRRLGADSLQRQELLWLVPDKGAVVQFILIPLTIAAIQLFNFRGLYQLTAIDWSVMCGLAITFGTYFLLVLGPRSLASEGGALWLALTWPQGLQELLKAKARLWCRVANFVVGGMLVRRRRDFPGGLVEDHSRLLRLAPVQRDAFAQGGVAGYGIVAGR